MYFCTLFNSYYLHKGIATYLSLEEVSDDFHLYVMAFDRKCYESLKSFNFQHMTVELLDDFETQELLSVKPTRNLAEYCWTCTPYVTYHFMMSYNLPSITYIDADLYFINSPRVLLDEIGSASIGLSEHWFDYENHRAGRFCVQFNYFKNDEEGVNALKYWKDSCLDWCYARYEDGKFGDQYYVEEIYHKYRDVHVIENRGCGIAPWNENNYDFDTKDEISYQGKQYASIFYHFHGALFLVEKDKLILTSGDGAINEKTGKIFYLPYLQLMQQVYNQYLNIKISEIEVRDINKRKKIFNWLKHKLSCNPIARYIYYNVLDIRYTGFEKK